VTAGVDQVEGVVVQGAGGFQGFGALERSDAADHRQHPGRGEGEGAAAERRRAVAEVPQQEHGEGRDRDAGGDFEQLEAPAVDLRAGGEVADPGAGGVSPLGQQGFQHPEVAEQARGEAGDGDVARRTWWSPVGGDRCVRVGLLHCPPP
jgi:hypothetical protein